jgi:hypothetical protein
MPSHLLSCASCGKSLPVEVGQAGGQVQCPCGARVDVPALRQLRQLPEASAAADERRRWSAGQGVLATCLVLVGLFVIVAGWSRWSEPAVQQFDPAKHNREMEQAVDELTPVQGWSVWVTSLQPLGDTGFFELDTGPPAAVKEQIARARFFQATMLVLAAVSVAGVVLVAVSRRALRQS